MTDDIWQEGADDRECGDCGCTSYSCTCYNHDCINCLKSIDVEDAFKWNDYYFCDETCLELFINE